MKKIATALALVLGTIAGAKADTMSAADLLKEASHDAQLFYMAAAGDSIE